MDADAHVAPLARTVTTPPGQPPDVDGTCGVPAPRRLLGGILSAEQEAAARGARRAELGLRLRSLGWIAEQVTTVQEAVTNNDSAKVAYFIVLRDEVVARSLAVVDQRKKQRVDEMLLCRADPQHVDKLQKVLLMYLQHGIFLQICITCYVKKEKVVSLPPVPGHN